MKMKTILVLTCSLALAGAVWAEPADIPHKKKGGGKGQQQQQQSGKSKKLGKQGGGGAGLHGQQGLGSKKLGKRGGEGAGLQGQQDLGSKKLGKHGGGDAGQLGDAGQQGKGQHLDKMQKHAGKFQAKHFNLKKGPNEKIAAQKFEHGRRIEHSEKWQGKNYEVFRNYRCEWHDHDWWHSHHNRIILISGGWYFWDAGFWFPAWGYDTVHVYYPYDGPIRAYNNLPPDQVVANVQAALQAQGYYTGEVDGLLGPLTRSALASYQRDHGLYETAAVDDPTLESLGMS